MKYNIPLAYLAAVRTLAKEVNAEFTDQRALHEPLSEIPSTSGLYAQG